MRRWMKLLIGIVSMLCLIGYGMTDGLDDGFKGWLLMIIGVLGMFILIDVNYEEED
jgi:hypothetical protein